jgi:hypothetical protein
LVIFDSIAASLLPQGSLFAVFRAVFRGAFLGCADNPKSRKSRKVEKAASRDFRAGTREKEAAHGLPQVSPPSTKSTTIGVRGEHVLTRFVTENGLISDAHPKHGRTTTHSESRATGSRAVDGVGSTTGQLGVRTIARRREARLAATEVTHEGGSRKNEAAGHGATGNHRGRRARRRRRRRDVGGFTDRGHVARWIRRARNLERGVRADREAAAKTDASVTRTTKTDTIARASSHEVLANQVDLEPIAGGKRSLQHSVVGSTNDNKTQSTLIPRTASSRWNSESRIRLGC